MKLTTFDFAGNAHSLENFTQWLSFTGDREQLFFRTFLDYLARFVSFAKKKKRDMLPRFCRPLWCKFDFRFIMYSEVSWCWHPHMSISLTKLTPSQAWRALKRLFIPFCYFLSQYFAKLSAVLQTFVELSCVWSISSMSRVIKLLRDSNIN